MAQDAQHTQTADDVLSTAIPETSRTLTETQKSHVEELVEFADSSIEVDEVVRLDNGTIELWLTDAGTGGSIMFTESIDVRYMYANEGILCVDHAYAETNYEIYIAPRGGDA